MSTEKKSHEIIPKKNGGARPGAGRPKGSGTKLTVNTLLKTIDASLGISLEQQIVNNYIRALDDPKLAFQYDQAFMNKAMADRFQVEVDETATVESRHTAFLKALETIGTTVLKQEAVIDYEDGNVSYDMATRLPANTVIDIDSKSNE